MTILRNMEGVMVPIVLGQVTRRPAVTEIHMVTLPAVGTRRLET